MDLNVCCSDSNQQQLYVRESRKIVLIYTKLNQDGHARSVSDHTAVREDLKNYTPIHFFNALKERGNKYSS